MPAEIKPQYDTSPTDLTVTSLASLAADTIWQSGNLDPGNPAPAKVRVSYELIFNATPIAGDQVEWFYASADEAASNEIINGGIGTSVGAITTAANIAAAVQACDCVHVHAWDTSHGTTFKGSFDVEDPGPSYQLLCRVVGEALSSGTQRVRIRYSSPEYQG